jgi:hypothetical protein
MQTLQPAPKKQWTTPVVLDIRPGHLAPDTIALSNETDPFPTGLPRAA